MLDILDKKIFTINGIKKELIKYLNKDVIIKYDLGRNKIDTYNAIIKTMYNCIFLIQVKETKEIKSFTYTDIITKTIKIYI